MRDLSVVCQTTNLQVFTIQTRLSIGRLRAPAVDGVVDGRVDWRQFALIR